MKKTEIIQLMSKIKTGYPNFILNTFEKIEWENLLVKYDYADVDNSIREYMENEFTHSKLPNIHFLLKGLTKTDDKGGAKKTITKCAECGRPIEFDQMEDHVARHNSVYYLMTKSKKLFDRDLNKTKLMEMPEPEFDVLYDQILRQIQTATPDVDEKRRIFMYFKTKAEAMGTPL